jgi:hypothetical protein
LGDSFAASIAHWVSKSERERSIEPEFRCRGAFGMSLSNDASKHIRFKLYFFSDAAFRFLDGDQSRWCSFFATEFFVEESSFQKRCWIYALSRLIGEQIIVSNSKFEDSK